MPKKTCDNPFKHKHKKTKKGYINVTQCNSDFLEEIRPFFQNVDLKDGLKLCDVCRLFIHNEMKRRKEAKSVLDAVINLIEGDVQDAEEPGATSTSPSAPSAPMEREENSQPFQFCDSSIVSGAPESSTVSAAFGDDLRRSKLNTIMSSIGESPVKFSSSLDARKRPGEVSSKFEKASASLKKLFMDFTGADFEAKVCKCQTCVSIINAVKAKFSSTNSKKEKYWMLTALPKHISGEKMQHEFLVPRRMAKEAVKLRNEQGPFAAPVFKDKSHALDAAVTEAVKQFYLSDLNSKASSVARETILVRRENGEKERVARRIMIGSLREAYAEFKQQHPQVKVGITSFSLAKPQECRWAGNRPVHVTCACFYHENFKLYLNAIRLAMIKNLDEETEETQRVLDLLKNDKLVMQSFFCSDATENCYLGFCSYCPMEASVETLFKFIMEEDEISLRLWDNSASKLNDKITVTGGELKDKFRTFLETFLEHDFIYQKQKKAIYELRHSALREKKSAVVLVDFAENMSFIVQNAIQSYHWVNSSATLHPFVVYTQNEDGEVKYKTFMIISSDLSHDTSSFHVFRMAVVRRIKESYPYVQHIEYVSDGGPAHYKNYKNICLLTHHFSDFGLSANWSFFASSHGKSTCDAMAAVTKRGIRLKVLRDERIIICAEEMFRVATEEMTTATLEFIFIKKEDVDLYRPMLDERYAGIKKIPSLRKAHFIGVEQDGSVITKRYSYAEEFQKYYLRRDYTPPPVTNLSLENFYAVKIGNKFQIGRVTNINHDSLSVNMCMMMRSGKGGLRLLWPTVEKNNEFAFSQILCNVSAPDLVGDTYTISQADLRELREKFNLK